MKFTGNTSECLAEYAKAYCEDPLERKQKMATFCGSTAQTVHRWLSGLQEPIGEYLIKVRYYLDLLGFSVEELENMDPLVKEAGRLFVYGVASFDDVRQAFAYEEGQNGRNNTMAVLCGKRNLGSEHRREKVQEFNDSNHDLLEEQRGVLLEEHASFCLSNTPSEVSAPCVDVRSETVPAFAENLYQIRALAYMVLAMIPLSEEALSNRYSAEDRRLLRELSGGDGVFRLSNLLNRLCGEKARANL